LEIPLIGDYCGVELAHIRYIAGVQRDCHSAQAGKAGGTTKPYNQRLSNQISCIKSGTIGIAF